MALAFPPIIVALFISAIAGTGVLSPVLAIGIAYTPYYARTMLNLASTVMDADCKSGTNAWHTEKVDFFYATCFRTSLLRYCFSLVLVLRRPWSLFRCSVFLALA